MSVMHFANALVWEIIGPAMAGPTGPCATPMLHNQIESGLQVCSTFQKIPCLTDWLASGIQVSVSFEIFCGELICEGGGICHLMNSSWTDVVCSES